MFAHPLCADDRALLYRLRGAAEEPINSKARTSTVLGLPPEHPTLPSLLQAAGYRTALMGKWHLGYPPAFGPLRSGYDDFFGPMAGGVDYFTHCNSTGVHDLWFGEEEKKEDGYLTDLISRHAVDYVDRLAQQGAPFFLSLHYTAPHRTGPGKVAMTKPSPLPWPTIFSTCRAATSTPTAA